MRKLLVASQKGGVGKTTTSINLAAATALAGARVLLLDADPLSSISSSLNLGQHAQRQPLRQAGVDLPGVLVSNVLPGLDVLSPYEDGGCSDDDLEMLLSCFATSAFQECYGCLVVDTPPFLGANPPQPAVHLRRTHPRHAPNRSPHAPCRPFSNWCSGRARRKSACAASC